MAREKRTPEHLRTAAELLAACSEKLQKAAETVENSGLDAIVIHGGVILNTYLPAIWDWACRVPTEAEIQAGDFQRNRPTQAVLNKTRSKKDMERRRLKQKGKP